MDAKGVYGSNLDLKSGDLDLNPDSRHQGYGPRSDPKPQGSIIGAFRPLN